MQKAAISSGSKLVPRPFTGSIMYAHLPCTIPADGAELSIAVQQEPIHEHASATIFYRQGLLHYKAWATSESKAYTRNSREWISWEKTAYWDKLPARWWSMNLCMDYLLCFDQLVKSKQATNGSSVLGSKNITKKIEEFWGISTQRLRIERTANFKEELYNHSRKF